MGQKHLSLSEGEKQKIVDLRKEGFSLRCIARRMGISSCTVHRYIHKNKKDRPT